jgi:hypothetical protein
MKIAIIRFRSLSLRSNTTDGQIGRLTDTASIQREEELAEVWEETIVIYGTLIRPIDQAWYLALALNEPSSTWERIGQRRRNL